MSDSLSEAHKRNIEYTKQLAMLAYSESTGILTQKECQIIRKYLKKKYQHVSSLLSVD